MRRRSFLALSVTAILAATASAAFGDAATDWPAYLFNARHPSKSASTAITPQNAGSLSKAWSFTAPAVTGAPGRRFISSPVVSGGRVFIGSNTGVFYALSESTGSVLWSRTFGFVKKITCNSSRGFAATAAVAGDPATGKPAAYVATGDGYLVAMDAATGSVLWKSVIAIPSTTKNDYFDWSSPTVANGKVYVGVSSQCDAPLVRAGVKMYSQATGALEATWYSVPAGSIGGSVWSSVAADLTSVYVTTGNAPSSVGDALSIVRLSASTLARQAGWKVPSGDRVADSDFGGSPTVFFRSGTEYVGACNKNGYYYLLTAQDLALVWKRRLSVGTPDGNHACLAAAVWDGSRLFAAGASTTIGGTTYPGSIRQLNPATGASVWERGLPGIPIGSPSLNGAGVLAVPLYDSGGVVLMNAATGAVLRSLPAGRLFAQPAFAGPYLFAASIGGVLTAYHVV